MRSVFRTIATMALVVLALTAGSSSALAAPANGVQTGTFPLDDEWCFQDGDTRYCTEVDGFARYTATADGRERVTMNVRQHIVVTQDGVVVGETSSVTVDKTIYADGGLFGMQIITHRRGDIDGQSCVLTAVLRITDFEFQFYHWNGPDCA